MRAKDDSQLHERGKENSKRKQEKLTNGLAITHEQVSDTLTEGTADNFVERKDEHPKTNRK